MKEHRGRLSESYDPDLIDAYVEETPEYDDHPKPHLTSEYK